MTKFMFAGVLLLAAMAVSWNAMTKAISKAAEEKNNELEQTAVTAAEQITNIGIESAVSIAKNIYTNEPVYDFLGKKYASNSEYFESYYPLLQNTALNTADTNIVKRCTIYTSNPTILAGGTIGKVETVQNEEWYKTMQKFHKPTVLSIDHKDRSITLVRKLDYISLDTGENYLCLKISSSFIEDFIKSIDFDGQLYIMSGSDLLYSSDENVKSVADIRITPDFESKKHNYYTVDLEFYSCANKKSAASQIMEDKILLPCLITVLLVFFVTVITMAQGISRRIRPVLREYTKEGRILLLEKGANGRDEIGKLLDICSEMSEHLTRKGSEYKESSDSLLKKSSDYNSLYATALRLDAELAVITRMLYLHKPFENEMIAFAEEVKMLEKYAEKSGKQCTCSDIGTAALQVPAYALVLIAEDIFGNMNGTAAAVEAAENGANVIFEGSSIPPQTDLLKLQAIFEDGDISSAYSFGKGYRFNPYLRLKHALGSDISVTIHTKDSLSVIFSFRSRKEKEEKV